MWFLLVFSVVLAAGYAWGSYALAPKVPEQKPPNLADIETPTAEQGRPIPVIFGTVTTKSPNVVWYGDLYYEPVRN